MTYSLMVTNVGPGPAPGLMVTDTLPSQVAFLSASPGCTNFGGVVVCGTPLLAAGGTTNFTLQVIPTAPGKITNAVIGASALTDIDPANSFSSLVTPVYAAPFILSQPASQVAVLGNAASFSVAATGLAPLSYQWTLAGTNVPDATSAVLMLPSVQLSQAGTYSVVVTNLAGVTNSDSAMLRVLAPPMIQLSNPGVGSTNILLSLASVAGLNYSLEYKNSLADSNWTPVAAALIGNGGTLVLQDTNGPFGFSRFYRVKCN
jgi:hypothetical protein